MTREEGMSNELIAFAVFIYLLLSLQLAWAGGLF